MNKFVCTKNPLLLFATLPFMLTYLILFNLPLLFYFIHIFVTHIFAMFFLFVYIDLLFECVCDIYICINYYVLRYNFNVF